MCLIALYPVLPRNSPQALAYIIGVKYLVIMNVDKRRRILWCKAYSLRCGVYTCAVTSVKHSLYLLFSVCIN